MCAILAGTSKAEYLPSPAVPDSLDPEQAHQASKSHHRLLNEAMAAETHPILNDSMLSAPLQELLNFQPKYLQCWGASPVAEVATNLHCHYGVDLEAYHHCR